ncbi:hypothetical protein CDL12_10412 [Handroanthus impetiginosus]|uniref:HAT C-terminal dimerisation domain-containing protein n=1 Tax=Handroanthus impetiginosus TaxID=429701 RepID=A0A2G9HH96_9LAMI|nr:hypothetical protein CDL12_10412 [Handroanthus impetiginosus]
MVSLFGFSAPALQRLVIKILSLTCDSFGCQRNWSVFEHRRLLLLQRYDNRDLIDAIMLDSDTLDGTNEWLVGRTEEEDVDELFKDNNLTCGNVGEATGVDEDVYNFRSRKSSATVLTHSRGNKCKSSTSGMTKNAFNLSRLAFLNSDEEKFTTNQNDIEEEDELDNACSQSYDDEDELNLDKDDACSLSYACKVELDVVRFFNKARALCYRPRGLLCNATLCTTKTIHGITLKHTSSTLA